MKNLKRDLDNEKVYKVEIHPKEDACPNVDKASDSVDCNACEFCRYIGTLGGEYYIDCTYDELDTTAEK